MDSAYGQNTPSTSTDIGTDPTTSIPDRAYGVGTAAGSSGANTSESNLESARIALGSGNTGNGASISVYS